MNIAVFFGGRSCEHDISILTALPAIGAARLRHKVFPIYIARDGRWLTGNNLDKLSTFSAPVKGRAVTLHPADPHLYDLKGRKLCRLDVALLCNHGMGGEDGSLQGFLTMCGIPYSGSDIRASAIGMDKISMKEVFLASQLPILPYRAVGKDSDLDQLVEALGLPLIVKPSNLGSSIGISVAHTRQELEDALSVAFEWDYRVLVEPALTDFIEVNCAVLSTDRGLISSEVEQPVGWREFLTYSDKYLADCDSPKCSVGRKMPAELGEDTRAQIRDLAKSAFTALGCDGVARIDFLVHKEKIYINEINTIPGSLSSYLFAYDGITYDELIDKLIFAALAQKAQKDALRYTYNSPVLISPKISPKHK